MSTTTTTDLPISRTAAAPHTASRRLVQAFWTGLRGRMLVAETRSATRHLDTRLRDDIGLGPRPVQPPGISPMADAWMR